MGEIDTAGAQELLSGMGASWLLAMQNSQQFSAQSRHVGETDIAAVLGAAWMELQGGLRVDGLHELANVYLSARLQPG